MKQTSSMAWAPTVAANMVAASERFAVTFPAAEQARIAEKAARKFARAHPDWIPRVSPHPGRHVSYVVGFRQRDSAAMAWDMMDERPSTYAGLGMGTHLAVPLLGLALIDNTYPERLAVACAEQGRYKFLFAATPLRLVGSTGAPAYPLAIFS